MSVTALPGITRLTTEAMALSDRLTTDAYEHCASRPPFTHGGHTYRFLEADEYAARGYADTAGDLLLAENEDGGLLEVWPHMGVQAALPRPPLPGAGGAA